jgi:hypothetical protein
MMKYSMPLSSIRVDIDTERTRQNDLVTGMGGQHDDHLNTPIVYDGIDYTTRGFNLHSKGGIVIFLDPFGINYNILRAGGEVYENVIATILENNGGRFNDLVQRVKSELH